MTTNASFCLFICTFVFASNSGHFRINNFLLFFTPLLLLNYFLFNSFLFLQKSGRAKELPAPTSARSLACRTPIYHPDPFEDFRIVRKETEDCWRFRENCRIFASNIGSSVKGFGHLWKTKSERAWAGRNMCIYLFSARERAEFNKSSSLIGS